MGVPPREYAKLFIMYDEKLPCKNLYLFAGRSKWLDGDPYLLDVALKHLIHRGLPGRRLLQTLLFSMEIRGGGQISNQTGVIA